MHVINPPFMQLHPRTVEELLKHSTANEELNTVSAVSIILLYVVVFAFFAGLILYVRRLENSEDNSDHDDAPPPIRVFMSYRDLLQADSGYGGSSSTSGVNSPSHLSVRVSSSEEAGNDNDNEGEEANQTSPA